VSSSNDENSDMTDHSHSEDPGSVEPSSRQEVLDWIFWQTRGCTPSLVLILIIGSLIGVTLSYRPLFQPATDVSTPVGFEDMNRPIFTFRQLQLDGPFYYVDRPSGQEMTDIFTLTISGTEKITLNLTNSPDFAELFPVLSPTDDRVAFFAVSRKADHSLRVLQPGRGVLDVTYPGVVSRLGDDCQIDLGLQPQWGPDGTWIAFLGRCGDEKNEAIEMFVTRADGTEVRPVTETGNRITSVGWLDNQTLIYGEERANGSGAIYRVSLADPEVQPELLRVVNVPE
jgi:hypothetical protein